MVQQLNETFHKVLDDCKQINVPNMLHNTSAATTTAEKLLYDYAVEIVSNSYLMKISIYYNPCIIHVKPKFYLSMQGLTKPT